MIRGKAGASGSPGGSIYLVAGELASPSGLAGFRIDTSGGLGGPPGDSGALDCQRGPLRCSSDACSAGVPSGPVGPRGRVFVTMRGAVAKVARARLEASLGAVESENAMALGDEADVGARAAELDALAIQKGWTRHAGEESY
jgi:hypothetical protein